ncbi:MAG: alanine--tRNA ligase [Planctomycetota bacterium]|nr:MAG: alanine--tRNA ligase [Planctomycetota bacterium]
MSYPRTSAEIREAYLSFFEGRGHTRLRSDSLVPAKDPTLLFTGAGMNQFKDEFLGRGRRDLKRATTAQKCLRVPDLENVGLTPRHHTFFEMLGNFSFGDYFKAETIAWEWQFFTETLGWDPGRLVATVYTDDDEAFAIWRDRIGLPAARIFRFGEKENFWPASAPSKGPNGPCGPCSEIYFDQEPAQPLPGAHGLEKLPDRFLEVGNCVFTQFDRAGDHRLVPLPQKNIDVGLGLERIAAVAQGVPNNFETDLFLPSLDRLASLAGRRYVRDSQDGVRMRRIADHARAVFFCIADGAAPGRDGRGYVVRKILRRAVRDGIELGLRRPFLAEMLPAVQQVMAVAYPELKEQQGAIQALVLGEEERFRDTYRLGIARLEAALEELQHQRGVTLFPGTLAFELHDTYGFPSDITEVIVRERGLELDQAGFERAMEEQRERARSGSALSGKVFADSLKGAVAASAEGTQRSVFVGYDCDQCDTAVEAIVVPEGEGLRSVDQVAPAQECSVVLRLTPFYAEGGGQVGDRGVLRAAGGGAVVFQVEDTTRDGDDHFHRGKALAPLRVGMAVRAEVDTAARRATEAHHTATHLLHAALKQALGPQVNQAGSLVAPDRLRFDYTHGQAPAPEQLRQIEDLVNREVLAAKDVPRRMTSLEQAKAEGVVALFGEKYGSEVRVVEVPGFSKELCGGTHVRNTGAIGPFRILSDRALAAGVRRMEAVAGMAALHSFRQDQALLGQLSESLKAPAERLLERVAALKDELKQARSARRAAVPDAHGLIAELRSAGGALAWRRIEGLDAEGLRGLADQLRGRAELPPIVLLAGGDAGSVPFVILCRQPQSGVRAGDLARRFGQMLGGGGGGRPDFAQGQGAAAEGLQAAVAELEQALPSPA